MIAGMTSEQIARMEREMESLQRDFTQVEASYGEDVLQLGHCVRVCLHLGNAHIARYLAQHHGELLPEFKAIVNASSSTRRRGTRARSPQRGLAA